MLSGKNIATWLTWLIPLILAILIGLLLPLKSKPYHFVLESTAGIGLSENARLYYNDLDFDGNSERIISFSNSVKEHAIQAFSFDGGRYGQQNIQGHFSDGANQLFFGDHNNNGFKEIVMLTRNVDSIYLTAFEVDTTNNERFFSSVFIDTINKVWRDPDLQVSPKCGYNVDLNSDGKNEFVGIINAGYARAPRKVFSYDFVSDSLMLSPLFGNVFSDLLFIDWDQDGTTEITGSMDSPGNYEDSVSIPMHDKSAWALMLDSSLQPKFEAIRFEGEGSSIKLLPWNSKQGPALAGVSYYKGIKQKLPLLFTIRQPFRMIVLDTLSPLRKDVEFYLIDTSLSKDSSLLWMNSLGEFYRFKKGKSKRIKPRLPVSVYSVPFSIDIDGDGKNEIGVREHASNHLLFIRNDRFYEITIPDNAENPFTCQMIKRVNDVDLLSIQSGSREYKYLFTINWIYYLRIPILIGIFLFFFLFIKLAQRIQIVRTENQQKQVRQIQELQLKTVLNQLDPHFTFNALNVISALAIEQKIDDLDTYISHFSKLLRWQISSSRDIMVTLMNEIEFVDHYIELQSIRFPKLFSYEKEISHHADEGLLIPKMLIQTHVENAIKHGLMTKKTGGKILLRVFPEDDSLKIIIEDNGIGRKAAKERKTFGTGSGLATLRDVFSFLASQKLCQITQKFYDLTNNDGSCRGTRVDITIFNS